jgi:hypothetical protein
MWIFDGYKMTAFTDEEEDKSEPGKSACPGTWRRRCESWHDLRRW